MFENVLKTGSLEKDIFWVGTKKHFKNTMRAGRITCSDVKYLSITGDSGYPLEPWLLTPYPDRAAEDDYKLRFNLVQKTTRSVVERAIGTWKSRFRSMCK